MVALLLVPAPFCCLHQRSEEHALLERFVHVSVQQTIQSFKVKLHRHPVRWKQIPGARPKQQFILSRELGSRHKYLRSHACSWYRLLKVFTSPDIDLDRFQSPRRAWLNTNAKPLKNPTEGNRSCVLACQSRRLSLTRTPPVSAWPLSRPFSL